MQCGADGMCSLPPRVKINQYVKLSSKTVQQNVSDNLDTFFTRSAELQIQTYSISDDEAPSKAFKVHQYKQKRQEPVMVKMSVPRAKTSTNTEY